MVDYPLINEGIMDDYHDNETCLFCLNQEEVFRRKYIVGFEEQDVFILSAHQDIIKSKLTPIVELIVKECLKSEPFLSELEKIIKNQVFSVMMSDYIDQLVSGKYDDEYIRKRIEIGRWYRNIGASVDTILCMINILKHSILHNIHTDLESGDLYMLVRSLDKIIMFDSYLILDVFIDEVVDKEKDINREMSIYISKLETKIKESRKLVGQDPTTGLFNVRYMMETLKTMVEAAKRRNEPLSCVYIDINSFKKINDNYGHCYGNEVLSQFGISIKAISRAEDACFRCGETSFVYFCLIVQEMML